MSKKQTPTYTLEDLTNEEREMLFSMTYRQFYRKYGKLSHWCEYLVHRYLEALSGGNGPVYLDNIRMDTILRGTTTGYDYKGVERVTCRKVINARSE